MRILCLLLLAMLLTACVTPPPERVENICQVFKQYPRWYWDAKKTQQKWGVPVNVQMAIIYQESRFNAKAKPPRRRLLWIIPWKRPSSAYGYSQALKQTWQKYKRSTGKSADRDEFTDATDFIGWYSHQAKMQLGISPYNAYALYLAYHEGTGGYKLHTYWAKPWLIQVAHKVQQRAFVYQQQLQKCQSKIKKIHWWNVFS